MHSERERSWTLRSQVLAGLALVLLVVALCVGAFTYWTTRQALADRQLQHARLLGEAVSAVLEPLASGSSNSARMQRLAARLCGSPYIEGIAVADVKMRRLARCGRQRSLSPVETGLRRSMRTEQQLVLAVGESQVVQVLTPIVSPDRIVGAVSIALRMGERSQASMATFWVLLVADSFVLLLFVGLVISRYVGRPIESLRRAAARVAEGDLTVQIDEDGAYELASLAASFNQMTGALREQLRDLQQQRRSLIQSEKLASVGRLAAGVAHEVGNPLQSIVGFTDLLLDNDLDSSSRQDLLQRVQNEAARIHGIVSELLDFSRPVSDTLEAVEISSVASQALALVAPQKRFRNVDVRLYGLDGLPMVSANGSRLVQVLLNLLLNAADAIDNDGHVTMIGSEVAGQVILRVSNSGREIAEDDRGRIFDPFFTTKDPGRGTGLGLSVAQSIVDSFGGQLTFANAQPTTFEIRLNRWSDDK